MPCVTGFTENDDFSHKICAGIAPSLAPWRLTLRPPSTAASIKQLLVANVVLQSATICILRCALLVAFCVPRPLHFADFQIADGRVERNATHRVTIKQKQSEQQIIAREFDFIFAKGAL
jgi:hypothetical protein